MKRQKSLRERFQEPQPKTQRSLRERFAQANADAIITGIRGSEQSLRSRFSTNETSVAATSPTRSSAADNLSSSFDFGSALRSRLNSSFAQSVDLVQPLLAAIAILYLILRFGFTSRVDALSPYAFYAIEIALVSLTAFATTRKFKLEFNFNAIQIVTALGAFGAGLAAFGFAGIAAGKVPFELRNFETIFFLLLVAPILEEAIFRFMLWRPIENYFSTKAAFITTSVLFSYAHLHARWFVPTDIHPFIYYQTLYTLPLAFVCGWMIMRQRSLTAAMLIHFAFNFGFFMGSFV